MARFLGSNAPWGALVDHGHVALHHVDVHHRFRVWPDLELEFIPVPHRHDGSDTVAISVEGSALYLPDIDSWAEWAEATEVVASHRTALLDATFWSAGELPGRDLGEIPHPLVPDTLERFGDLAQDRRLILTHLNHSNPVSDPRSPQYAAVLEAGFEVAVEGMVIPI
jgi:pyrroloquinoline quinone biosynthesis protein B